MASKAFSCAHTVDCTFEITPGRSIDLNGAVQLRQPRVVKPETRVRRERPRQQSGGVVPRLWGHWFPAVQVGMIGGGTTATEHR